MPHSTSAPDPSDLRRVVWWGLLVVTGAMVVGEWAAPDAGAKHAGFIDAGYRIDVNRDDAATLQLLPGIGPSIADNLVAWRQAHGPIKSPQDLENVKMIGPILRERITPWVQFGPPPHPASGAQTAHPPDTSR